MMIHKLAPVVNSQPSCQKILCFYINSTSSLQIVRLEHLSSGNFERVVFPGERLLFEALPEAVLEIHTSETPSTILADKIPCSRLQVEEGVNLFIPGKVADTAA